MQKAEIRKSILNKRLGLPDEVVREKSKRILQGLSLLYNFQNSRIIMCYMDFRKEVMTSDIIQYCISLDKIVAVPCCVTTPEGVCGLELYEVRDLSCDVCAGKYGILEPRQDSLKQISPDAIDIVLVPGVVFDLNKNRIGYGAGYYDRFLRSVNPRCFKAGLAFDLQVVDSLPAEEHDMKMDSIITESRIIF